MSPQTVPTAPPLEQIPANLEKATASNPVAPTIPFQPNLGNLLLANSQPAQEIAPISKKSPQSSPIAARLSRQDLRDLMRLCDQEVGHCGLDTDAGRRALELRDKLVAVHAHGNHP